jgi:hypothetical protein
MDRHGGDGLAQIEASHAFAELIDGSDKIPTRRIGHARRFGMDSLARQDVRKTDSRRRHLHPYLACRRSRDIFLDNRDHFRAAVAGDDCSLVAHFLTLRSGECLLVAAVRLIWHKHRPQSLISINVLLRPWRVDFRQGLAWPSVMNPPLDRRS